MLLYTLALGPSERSIAQQAFRSGEPLPDRIENAPQLFEGLSLYFDAFFDLDTTRNHTFGFVRISILDVKEYAQAWEFDPEQTATLLYVIPRMDTDCIEYLKGRRLQTENAHAKRPSEPDAD